MKISEVNFEEYQSLEECCLDIESQVKINSEDEKNKLRWQIFNAWHAENGFSEEDEEWIRTCRFDTDMFITDQEYSRIKREKSEDRTDYRKHRSNLEREKTEYTKNATRKLKKVKGEKITPEERLKILRMQHKKDQEIYTVLIKAKKSLERLHKNTDEDYNIAPTQLVEEVFRLEKEIPCTQEELLHHAEEFINNDGVNARAALYITSEEFAKKADAYIEKNQKQLLAWFLIGFTIFNTLLLLTRYLTCMVTLDRIIISNHPIYILISLFIPVIAWIYMTTQDYFNYHNRKWAMLITVVVNASATLLQFVYTAAWDLLVVNVFKIKTNDLLTENMVLNLARICVGVALAIGIIICYNMVKPFLCAEEAKEKIVGFKLRHVVDTRQNKEYLYDFNQIKDLKTGKPIIVKEHDLYTHTLLLGASGTGKTSSIYIPQIIENIRKKMKNLEMQQRSVLRLVQLGKVAIVQPFKNGKFNKYNFEPITEDAKREFDEIFETYKECGITVVAPNNSMNEDILAYTSGRGIWINNLDPTKKKATHPYERLVGMNPFYIPPAFSKIAVGDEDAEEERTIYIAESANNFADALTAINELNGAGDQYFTDVNTTVTSSVSTVLMLNASINNTQVTIDDIYNHIIDFNLLVPVIQNIKRHFNIQYVNVVEDKNARNKAPQQTRNIAMAGMEEQQKKAEEAALEQKLYSIMTEEDKKNPYIQTIVTVESRLFKGSRMDEHAEGLRNLIGKLLQDPRVKRVLVTNKDIIDFNEILADNAITVVNTALEFGKNTSTCFGQLFLLNFNSAVLRRPKHLRTPHFLYEDETARYLSDTIDTMVTLYRQYNVSCMFALQSLKQVEKIPSLSYLKDTLLSAGTIITFGRANTDDSQQISDLGGKKNYEMIQHTRSYKSILSEDAASSYSDRSTPDQKAYIDPHEVRFRDFQECNIITSDEGRVVPARLAKANFVPKEVLYGEEKQQIRQNDMWREVWRLRQPHYEDVIPITKETVISSSETMETMAKLRESSDRTLVVEKSDMEKQIIASQAAQKTEVVSVMRDLLSSNRLPAYPISEEHMRDQIKYNKDWEDDDDWDFVESKEEEEYGFSEDNVKTEVQLTIQADTSPITTAALPQKETSDTQTVDNEEDVDDFMLEFEEEYIRRESDYPDEEKKSEEPEVGAEEAEIYELAEYDAYLQEIQRKRSERGEVL